MIDKMIDQKIEKELHCCDLCKRRIQSTNIKTCCVCKKELCTYCRVSLTRIKRKYEDSGYLLLQRQIGNVCIICVKKKLKLKLKW